MPKFELTISDYGIEAHIVCEMNNDDCYPNQGDLRIAVDKLMQALHSWHKVEVTVKKEY
jgi:hypothetical protein